MAAPVVSADRITKRFAGHTAVRSLSLTVPGGGLHGLLGPNGAGKTTTIRMLLNIITPDEGRVVLFGSEGSGRELSERIGYLPEERGLYPKMKVLDQLAFLGEAKGLSRWDARKRAKAWLERLGLGEWALRKVSDLSKGMQQKVQFAGALQHDPDLVILDEPFSGLDPVNSQVMRDVVVELARAGRTVLFSTHIMEHAEKMCDSVVIIARGEKVVDGPLAQIKREFGKSHVALAFSRNQAAAKRVLADRTLVAHADDAGATAEVELAAGTDPEGLLRTLVQADVGLSRFEVVEPSLQSIFIAKVGGDAALAAARQEG
ncbi:MAG: ATP-binding cassette domain-containing protein [Gemmatimonadales bacterium]|nr:MAG: ATP-binding cassette domain-containing protein [Gemmatimonadales bacterium]